MRERLSPRLIAVLLAALALFVSACGSDQLEGETDSSIESTDTGSEDDGSGGDDGEGDDAASSGLADEGESDDASTSEMVDEGLSLTSGTFCERYIENQSLVDEFNIFDPVQAEQWIGMSVGLLDEAIADAPGEVQADLQIIRSGMDDMISVLEANGYDFFAASDEIEAISDDAVVDAASDRIDAYVAANCGIDLDQQAEDLAEGMIDAESIESLLGNDAVLAAIIEGMTEGGAMTEDQATCFIQNLDPALIASLTEGGAAAMADPQAVQDLLGTFEACGIPLG